MPSFACPSCGRALKVSDELAGRRGRCPHCKAAVLVPGAVPAGTIPGEGAAPPPPAPSLGESATLLPGGGSASGLGTLGPGGVGQPDRSLTDFLAPPQQPGELGRLGGYRVL